MSDYFFLIRWFFAAKIYNRAVSQIYTLGIFLEANIKIEEFIFSLDVI
jgi:hypothetical protein